MKNDTIDAREIRRKLGLNQQQFWSKIGVTQSGGSRYESGRNMPRPVQQLLRLVHVEQIDIGKIKKRRLGSGRVPEVQRSGTVQVAEEGRPRPSPRKVTEPSGADVHGQPQRAQAFGNRRQPVLGQAG
jgi:transcriptional regulator with XRE-family HTH domain